MQLAGQSGNKLLAGRNNVFFYQIKFRFIHNQSVQRMRRVTLFVNGTPKNGKVGLNKGVNYVSDCWLKPGPRNDR